MIGLFINPTKFLRKHLYNLFLRMFSSFGNREKIARFLSDNMETLIIAFLLAMFIRSYIIAVFYIPSASMEDTLIEKDRLIGTRFDFVFRAPKIGEIVIFNHPNRPIKLIKRIVGTPGDTIQLVNNKLYRNGKYIDEPYIKLLGRFSLPFGPVTIPEHHYFVMGDNRDNSEDSRFWNLPYDFNKRSHFLSTPYWKNSDNVGFLHEKYIEARPIFRFWPINRMGVVQ